MLGIDQSTLRWRKSSFSEAGNCVEVATIRGRSALLVRDSQHRDSPILAISPSAWRELLQKIRSSTAF